MGTDEAQVIYDLAREEWRATAVVFISGQGHRQLCGYGDNPQAAVEALQREITTERDWL
jgi:hypothetical protein